VQLGEQTEFDDPGGIEVGQLLLGDISVGCAQKKTQRVRIEMMCCIIKYHS
jgi:hypothetical protein